MTLSKENEGDTIRYIIERAANNGGAHLIIAASVFLEDIGYSRDMVDDIAREIYEKIAGATV